MIQRIAGSRGLRYTTIIALVAVLVEWRVCAFYESK